MDISNVCKVCEKSFSKPSNLSRHMNNVHDLKMTKCYEFESYSFKCLEGCEVSFRSSKELRIHLDDTHNIRELINKEEMEFLSKQDFSIWYQQMCKENNVEYVKHNNGTPNTMYYYCNRSGVFKPKGNNLRQPKSKGSCKIGFSCTSQIIFKEVDGKFVVTYYKNHYGHKSEVQHIRITKEDRQVLAAKLTCGIPPAKILNDARDNIDCNKMKRIDLLKRKDINNLKSSINLDSNLRRTHKEDNHESSTIFGNNCKNDTEVDIHWKYVGQQSSENINTGEIGNIFGELEKEWSNVKDDDISLEIYDHISKTKALIPVLLKRTQVETCISIVVFADEPPNKKIAK